MKSIVHQALIAGSLSIIALTADAAGYRLIEVPDAGHNDLTVGLWYPSSKPAPEEPNTKYLLPVDLDGAPAGTNGGLIVISHGFGGWYGGHADTAIALADAGYIVAAPTHTGNTWSDMSSPIEKWSVDRPRHISRVIDHLLVDDEFESSIDKDKIGVYGFSAGGFTVMNLIGGTPDLEHAMKVCEKTPEEFICAEFAIHSMLDANMHKLPKSVWGFDDRIDVAIASAPGFGFAYTEASLAQVSIPLQLWSGENDSSVPTQSNAASIAKNLPEKPETHWVKDANHFAFMVVQCKRDSFKRNSPEEYREVCGDAEGFNRSEFHVEMHREMIRFFDTNFEL